MIRVTIKPYRPQSFRNCPLSIIHCQLTSAEDYLNGMLAAVERGDNVSFNGLAVDGH